MTCLANAPAADTQKALFRRLSSLCTQFTRVAYLSVTKKGAAVTATVRLDAMSAKIAQTVEQGQPLLLFTQRLPIIRLGRAGCRLLFILIKMNIQ